MRCIYLLCVHHDCRNTNLQPGNVLPGHCISENRPVLIWTLILAAPFLLLCPGYEKRSESGPTLVLICWPYWEKFPGAPIFQTLLLTWGWPNPMKRPQDDLLNRGTGKHMSLHNGHIILEEIKKDGKILYSCHPTKRWELWRSGAGQTEGVLMKPLGSR